MKRRWLLGVAAIAGALFLWWWLGGDGRGGGARAGEPAGARGGGSGAARTVARRDPKAGGAASLAGTITGDGGGPVGGGWVCARLAEDDDDASIDDLRDPHCTTSGPDGRWRIDELWGARWTVLAGAPHRVAALWRDRANRRPWLRLAAGEARDGIDLVLDGGAVEATGVVLDLTGGTIAGALVEIQPETWGGARGACLTHSRDDGTFGCWVAPGTVWASADADGYALAWQTASVPGEKLELYLTPEATVGGVVVDAGSRAPVAGARVTLEDLDGGRSGGGAGVFTDAAGRFRFTRVTPGRYKPVASTPEAYGEAAESVLLGIAQSRDDLVIELHPATRVAGVVLAAGTPPAPAEECTVSLQRDDGRRYGDSTEADGAVAFEAVQPGTYGVTISCTHHVARARYDKLVVAGAPVEARWEVDAGLTLRGKVIDERGAPIAFANVTARVVGGDPRAPDAAGWASTDKDGTFEVTPLRAGTVEVDARSDRHVHELEPTKLEMTRDAEVTLRLSSGGTIAGVVVDQDGDPVSGVQVWTSGERWGNSVRGHDDGSFLVEGLAAGAYRVEASRGWDDGLRKPGSTDDDLQGERVRVAAGETAHVRLVVESAKGTIRGRVVDPAGRPVSDAYVKAERETDAAGAQKGRGLRQARWGWEDRPAITDVDGGFSLSKLSPGTYTVLAYRKGGSEASAQGVAIGAEVTLTIKPTAVLEGTLDSGGEPPREFTIELADPATGVDRTESFFLRGNAWAIRDLPAGTYDVTATAPAGSGALEDVALRDGEHKAGLVVSLRKKVQIRGRVVDGDTGAPVAGMRVFASSIEGAGGGFSFRGGGGDERVSDAGGRFEVDGVTQGRVRLTAWPKDWGATPYARGNRVVALGDGDPVDVGDLPVLKRRLPRGTRGGDLGFSLAEQPPDTDPEDVVLRVASIRSGGPADGTGLAVGDVIVSIDGRDVRGERSWQFRPTASVPEGTVLLLGLERGATVKLRVGSPE